MRFLDRVKRPKRPVVVYEILPPREKDGTLNSYAEMISSLLSQTHIDAINIPEIHEEVTRGDRPIADVVRAEPREFGKLIQDIVGVEAIINRVTVHENIETQTAWFKETSEDFEIENIILVGGESGDIDYQGPNVTEMSKILTNEEKRDMQPIFCGGITIPSRKKESIRLIKKAEAGIEYFTSQVIYESENINKMLSHYQKACDESSTFPRRILFSFAPISSKKNLDFLKWLGVKIPAETETYLMENPTLTATRSIEISIQILQDILNHIKENNLKIPIGLNVEHIMSYNFQHSIKMLQELSKVYRKFCIESTIY